MVTPAFRRKVVYEAAARISADVESIPAAIREEAREAVRVYLSRERLALAGKPSTLGIDRRGERSERSGDASSRLPLLL